MQILEKTANVSDKNRSIHVINTLSNLYIQKYINVHILHEVRKFLVIDFFS